MKPTQKQIDKYLKEVVNRKIKLPKHNPEFKKKIIAKFIDEEDGEGIALTKNLASEEGMKRAMAMMNKFWKWEKEQEEKEK